MGFQRIGGSEGAGDVVANAARRTALRRILACAWAATGLGAAPLRAQSRTPHRLNLPSAQDLAADAAASARERIPILLFFDRQDCPYCERALARYLVPMSQEDPWRGRAIFRQVEVGEPLPLADFDGRPITHAILAARYKATLSPTVAVVDGAGTILGTPVVGLLTADFYAAYLGAAIDEGVRKLRSPPG